MREAGESIGEGALSSAELALANINPTTGLATDYLNHFNEVVMLLDLLSAMPECRDDVLSWQPLSYEDHFMNSNFTARELAVRAYRAAPAAARATFDTLVTEMNTEVTSAQSVLDEAAREALPGLARHAADRLKPLIAKAAGVIHGHDGAADAGTEPECESSQADIDALFAQYT